MEAIILDEDYELIAEEMFPFNGSFAGRFPPRKKITAEDAKRIYREGKRREEEEKQGFIQLRLFR